MAYQLKGVEAFKAVFSSNVRSALTLIQRSAEVLVYNLIYIYISKALLSRDLMTEMELHAVPE